MGKIVKKKDGSVVLKADLKLYPLSTIYAAGYVFLDKCYIYLDKGKDGSVLIRLFPKDKKAGLDNLGMDFYNELLNYAHYFTSLKVNAESMKMLMQRALFSAAPSLTQEAEEKEIQDLIKELEEEEKKEAVKKK